jgi:hypothetical protein
MSEEKLSQAKCPNCKEVVCNSNMEIDQAVINIVAFHYADCKDK